MFNDFDTSFNMSMGESYRPRETYEFFKGMPDQDFDWKTLKNSFDMEEFDSFYSDYGYGVQVFDEPMGDIEYYSGGYDLPENVTKIKSSRRSGRRNSFERGEQMFEQAQERERLAYERSIERGEQMLERAQEREKLAYERSLAQSEREGIQTIKQHQREVDQEQLRMKHFALQLSNNMESFGRSIDNMNNAGIGFLSKF